jgi:hypothetical protein
MRLSAANGLGVTDADPRVIAESISHIEGFDAPSRSVTGTA